jgi:hypothetical protein
MAEVPASGFGGDEKAPARPSDPSQPIPSADAAGRRARKEA